MCIEPIHIWRCIEIGLEWNVVGRSLCLTLHIVNFCSTKAWLVFGMQRRRRLWMCRANLEHCETKLFTWKYPLKWLNLATIKIILYMAISITGSIAFNLRLLLAIKKLFQLHLCFLRNNNNLFCCLSHSSALSCSFAASCKAANATATNRAQAFQTN